MISNVISRAVGGRVRSCTFNGKAERFFRSLRLWSRTVLWALLGNRRATARSVQKRLDRFAEWYNNVRPHQGIDGHTPNEIWAGTDPPELMPVRWHDAQPVCRIQCRAHIRTGPQPCFHPATACPSVAASPSGHEGEGLGGPFLYAPTRGPSAVSSVLLIVEIGNSPSSTSKLTGPPPRSIPLARPRSSCCCLPLCSYSDSRRIRHRLGCRSGSFPSVTRSCAPTVNLARFLCRQSPVLLRHIRTRAKDTSTIRAQTSARTKCPQPP